MGKRFYHEQLFWHTIINSKQYHHNLISYNLEMQLWKSFYYLCCHHINSLPHGIMSFLINSKSKSHKAINTLSPEKMADIFTQNSHAHFHYFFCHQAAWVLGKSDHLVCLARIYYNHPDSKIHGANMGPIWGRQDPFGPHVGPTNLAIWYFDHEFW